MQVYVRQAEGRRTVGGDDLAAGEGGDGDDLGFGTGGAGTGPLGGPKGGVYKFYFNIGSVDSFEHAMEEAQEALGVGASRWVEEGEWQRISRDSVWKALCALANGTVW